MHTILALDLSSKTGFAVGRADGEPAYGTLHLKYSGESIGRPMLDLFQWLNDFISVNGVDFVAFEAPFSQGKGARDARKLICLAGTVELVCEGRGIAKTELDARALKKFWTGNGLASKAAMMEMCRAYGWDPKDDNASDALALWSYTVNWKHPDIFSSRKLNADFMRKK